MNEKSSYDFVVIGGGSAGTTAAMAAAGFSKKVLLIEKSELGGTCTNRGCVPTKSMLHGAELIRESGEAKDYGLDVDYHTKFDVIRRHRDNLTRAMRDSGTRVIERAGIDLLKGEASFSGGNRISVNGDSIVAKNILIAAGAAPMIPPIEGLDSIPYLTSESALQLENLPQTVTIAGGAYIGLEYANLFNTLGVKVTVIESHDRIAPNEDEEISKYLEESLVKQGIDIYSGARVTKVDKVENGYRVTAGPPDKVLEIISDQVMIATGRVLDFSPLNLESTDVKYDRKGIKVDDYLKATETGVYAAGDVVPSLQLEHVAVYEGWLAANNMFSGKPRTADYTVIPHVMFSHPEVASVGMTEEQAALEGEVAIELFPFAAIPMAQINEDTEGLIKLVADKKTGRLMGAHIVGTGAGNLVHLAALVMKFNIPLSKAGETVAAYPSLSQGFFYACDNLGEKIKK